MSIKWGNNNKKTDRKVPRVSSHVHPTERMFQEPREQTASVDPTSDLSFYFDYDVEID